MKKTLKRQPSKPDAERYKEKYNPTELTELIKTKDHVDILKWIRNEKLSLQSYAEADTDTKSIPPKSTLMRQILDEAENGDEIIKEILDSFVTKTPVGSKSISANSFNIKVDFSGIISVYDNGKQESVLNDLVKLWLSYKSEPWDKIKHLIMNGVEMCKQTKKRKKKSSPQIILGIHIVNYTIFHML